MRLNSNADFVRATTNEREQELYVNTVKYESFKDGLKEGIEEEKTKLIKNFYKIGTPIDSIAKGTNLDVSEVEKILFG